jgi:hypothetical protein
MLSVTPWPNSVLEAKGRQLSVKLMKLVEFLVLDLPMSFIDYENNYCYNYEPYILEV